VGIKESQSKQGVIKVAIKRSARVLLKHKKRRESGLCWSTSKKKRKYGLECADGWGRAEIKTMGSISDKQATRPNNTRNAGSTASV
jgi:hypothetical protein